MTQLHPQPSPNSTKKAVPETPAPRRRALPPNSAASTSKGQSLSWSHVLRVLSDDSTRAYALGRYRSRGFTPDDFARRLSARQAMADALTAAEDRLEQEHPGRLRERDALRVVRRRLEQELWP